MSTATTRRIATADTDPVDILKPYTVIPGAWRAARMCWINRQPLDPGTDAFLDGDGLAVCTECAEHCTSCTDEDCDHPQYAYAAQDQAAPVLDSIDPGPSEAQLNDWNIHNDHADGLVGDED